MKFYAYTEPCGGYLETIKEEGGKFYKLAYYSDGHWQYDEIAYLPKGAIELQNIENSTDKLELIDKRKWHKDIQQLLLKKYSGFVQKTERKLRGDLVITLIFEDSFFTEERSSFDVTREIFDYLENFFGNDLIFRVEIHVVSRTMWNTRRF